MLLGVKSTRQGVESKVCQPFISYGIDKILLKIESPGLLRFVPLKFTFAPMKILMVCLGNICRSPLAEAILQDKASRAGLDWSVESAGTNSYHIGEPPHRLSQKVARLHGLDISCQRARRFVAEDFDKYDKIYALAGDVLSDIRHIAKNKFDPSKIDLLMNELYPGKDMDVPDPWYGEEPGYHEAYKLLDEVCNKIVEKYTPTPKGALEADFNSK